MVSRQFRKLEIEGSIPSTGLFMENRIFVGNRENSIAFFKDIKVSGGFSSYQGIYHLLKVSHGNFWYIQTGKRSLTESKYKMLIEFLPQHIREKYQTIKIIRDANWGARKGGDATHYRHPNNILKARTIANRRAKEKIESQFDVNLPLTSEICEFLGAFAGDGCTNCYDGHHFTSFAGDSRFDWNYYQEKIIPITKKFFNMKHQTIRRKKNSMWVTFHSKLLHKMITERFQMPAGEKWNKVLVPQEIMKGKLENKAAFVRGVFDTDGCVFFDKRQIYKEHYMRVDITMINVPILTQLNQILTELGIESKVLGNGKHLHVTSKVEVRKFFEKVGSSNERHRAKIRQKYVDFDEWNPANKKTISSSILAHNY